MTIIHAFILGVIEGLTEFIPVSSTAHLLIAQSLLGIPSSGVVFAFLVLVQLGAVVSLLTYYRRELLDLGRAFFARPLSTPENRLAWYIIIATLPALIAGALLKRLIQDLFSAPLTEAVIRLLSVSVLMFLAEWFGRRIRKLSEINWFDALFIGILQVLAVFPGASRSGTTISAGMLRGLDRPSAARFAFLLAAPVLLAAGAYEALDVIKLPHLEEFLPSLLVGFIAAAAVGWFSIRWLLGYLGRHSLYVFAGYCSLLGVVLLFLNLH